MPAADAPRVAVLGQGSIGRRHAGLLVELGCEVVVFDPDASAQAPDGAHRARDEVGALAGADAAVVATPTSEHVRHAEAALAAGCAVLVEKPLASRAAEAEALIADAGEQLLAVAMNLRFHPGPAAVRDAVARGRIGAPLLARFEFGSYLPDWRPATDYRETYSARSALGGGVLLDLIHEIDLALWILGPVTEVGGWLERVSDLELDVEDVALLEMRMRSGALASISLDYLDRYYRRSCRVVGSEASVEWDLPAGRVRILGPRGVVDEMPTPPEVAGTYRTELETFVAAVTGDTSARGRLVSGAAALEALKAADAVRESAALGRRVLVAH